MDNRVRIECDQNIVTNAGIFLRNENGEWCDIRRAVQKATVSLEVGAISRAHLDLILVDSTVEAYALDDETLGAFADTLRDYGWTVEAPAGAAA